MINKSQRINFSENDKNIKVLLEQEVNSIDLLSLTLNTTEMYQSFNADYGVLVGRVVANNNIGVPNAKISIFIPINDEDKLNSDVLAHYPYETPRDKNSEGKRYNLLPRIGKINSDGFIRPKQTFGSFPIKEELYVDDILLGIYQKYYKYTALTNDSGDYMIFGVPIGLQTVHMSVDITDIGNYSMTPAAMVTNLGYSDKLFTDNGKKIKESTDLDDLPHIETQEITVNVIPFWGDVENFQIGITRQDFRIRATINGTFTIFGSVFTDGRESIWGHDDPDSTFLRISDLYHLSDERNFNTGISSKRYGKITPKLYTYPSDITYDEIIQDKNNINDSSLQEKMIVLTENDFSFHQDGSSFVIIVNCNRNKKISNEIGELIDTDDTNENGIYTKFIGFLTLEMNDTPIYGEFYIGRAIGKDISISPFRSKIKIPQRAEIGESFGFQYSTREHEHEHTYKWRKQVFEFENGKFYTVAKFFGTLVNNNTNARNHILPETNFLEGDKINNILDNGNNDIYAHRTVGGIITNDHFDEGNDEDVDAGNDNYNLIPNCIGKSGKKMFGANWLNFSVYLPQIGITDKAMSELNGGVVSNTAIGTVPLKSEMSDNIYLIAGTETNTFMFLRSDLHYTDFIEVNKNDINTMIYNENYNQNGGFKINKDSLESEGFLSDYKYGNSDDCPPSGNGGKVNGIPSNPYDNDVYFFKGLGNYDCIKFLEEIGNL